MAKLNLEEVKAASRSLRGTIGQSLADAEVTNFGEADMQLMKFHGIYQQDNRDSRLQRRKDKLEREWMLMVRSSVPGGRMTAAQYLVHDRSACELGNNTLRITSRQGLQFHGIYKGKVKQLMQDLNRSGITSWGACGDVVRNVMAAPVPSSVSVYRQVQEFARELAAAFRAPSKGYSEIWLDGEPMGGGVDAELEKAAQDLYGDTYLPRKFKFGIAIPPRNDIDVFTHDVGFVAHFPDGELQGFTVLVGGGMGMTHNKTETYPALAQVLLYVPLADALEVARAIVKVQRDHGDRENRRHARMKYLVYERGIDWFREQVQQRISCAVQQAKPFVFTTVSDSLGWHEQGDGKWYCGVRLEHGRIKDGEIKYMSAFRELAERFKRPMCFTANHNVYFYDVEPQQKDEIQAVLDTAGVPDAATLCAPRRTSISCVSMPTCGLGLAESERVFQSVMIKIEEILRKLGLEEEDILFRMTGCPNGCVRPYNADFAFVGRAPGKYAFYVGGCHTGQRMAAMQEKVILFDDIPAKVRPFLEDFATNRQANETFSDYWLRIHPQAGNFDPKQMHLEPAER